MTNVFTRAVPLFAGILVWVVSAAAASSASAQQFCVEEPCDQPPPVFDPRSPPHVSAAPHHGEYANALPGSATAAYSTPAYVSLDKPRSLSLLYASGMASPTTLIQIDATPGAGEVPTRLSIRVRNTHTGSWENLGGGTQELFYAYSSGTSRLAAQVETGAMATGGYTYEVVVRSHWIDGTWTEAAPVNVRVLVVNERSSPYGIGWIVAGVQRVIPGSGGVFLHEGDGSARWFAYPGTCTGTQTSQYCAYTSPAGDFTRLVRDTQTGGWLRRYADGTKVEFGPDGRMREHLSTQYQYDVSGRLVKVIDPSGQWISLGYDAAGRLAWIRDPGGRQVDVRVLASGLLDWICDPVSCALSATYDSRQRLTGLTDRGSARWDYEYDAWGKVSRTIAPAVVVEGQGAARPSTRYRSLETAALPAAGSGTSWNSAPQAAPGSARMTVTDAASNVVSISVDRYRNPLRIEEPLGRVTTIERDTHGLPVRSIAFSGDVTEYTYVDGLPATIRDVAANRTTTYTWSPLGHLMYPAGTVVRGYPLDVSAPGEPDLRYELAGADPYPTRVGTARYVVDEWDWNTGGPKLMYGPGGHTQYFYAAAGGRNLDSMSVFSGVDTLTTRFTRDAHGRVIRTVDPEGMATTVAYDALNRPTSTTDPAGTTSYAYAPGGWLNTLTDARSQQYVYQRNSLGWLEWERDPRGQTMYLGYDILGQQVSATNRRGQTVRYSHDALGQLWRRTTHEGAVTTYSYAPDGRWMAVANGEATDTLRTIRGAAPSVEQVTVRGGARYVVNTRRDLTGSYTHLSGSWGYNVYHHVASDGSGRLERLVDPSSATTVQTQDYTTNSNVYILPSGDSIVHEPYATRYTDPSARAPLSRIYRYSDGKKLLNRGLSDLDVHGYYYDLLGQIAGESKSENYVQVSQRTFSFDATGNPSGSGITVTAGNRLEVFDGFVLTYDADGNLTRKHRTGIGYDQYYTWNSLGQLVEVRGTTNGGASWTTTTNGYDGSGRRIRQTVNGVVTRYIYDGQHLIAETNAAGAVVREFSYYPGVDRPHSMRVGAQTYYYVTDHQGNVTGLVNTAGTLVNRYEYDTFGSPTVAVEGVANPLRFAGGRYDAATGLYANRMRFYDPHLRRFISEDPLGPAGGINLYSFAGNNPLNLRDPTGLSPCGYGEVLRGGKCVVAQVFRLPAVCSCTGDGWYEQWRIENAKSAEEQRKYMHERELYYAPDEELRQREVLDAVQSLRTVGDVGVGFVPGVSTVHDASVLFTGYNVVTGERVGLGGRGVAFVGMVTPVSGGQIRGGVKLGEHALKRMAERGVSSRMVEVAMERGTRYFDPKYNTIAHVLQGGFASGRSLTVWFDPLTDSVTSVLRSSKNPVRDRYVPLP